MATLVLIEDETGTLTRYETGGSAVRKTHRCSLGYSADIAPKVVEHFRLTPPDEFSIDPPPRPTGPPSGVGTIRQAA